MSKLPFALLATIAATTLVSSHSQTDPVLSDAHAFLQSLTPEQKTKLQHAFTDQERENWRFVPATRSGLTLGELTEPQKEALEKLLKSSLSPKGIQKVKNVESLEEILYELERQNPTRDKNLYTVTFFGEPSPRSAWGWRYEGHHLSLNFTYQGTRLLSSTPQFFGANPETVQSGPKQGFRALPQEKDLAFAFLKTLTPDQLKTAVVSQQAPFDILTGNTRKVGIQDKTGIPYIDLTQPQKDALLALLKVHAESQTESEFQRRWSRIDPDSVVFAWMGSTDPAQGHYYRIQGDTFLVEYDNVQNRANHIHSVWRDFENDFGRDLLQEHYSSHPHPHDH